MDGQTASQVLETAKYGCKSDHLRTGYGLHICQRCAVAAIHQYGNQVAREDAEIASAETQNSTAESRQAMNPEVIYERACRNIATAILRHRELP